MASLLLLVSQLLKHHNTDDQLYSTSTTFPFYSCGATTSTGFPCFVENRAAKLPDKTPAGQFCNKEDKFQQDLADSRVSVVDIVWP